GGVLLPARGFLRDAVPASGCRAFLDLCKIAFRRHAGCVTFGQRTPFFGMGILLFDEKPVFTLFVLLVPHSNKNPFALHALAFKRELEVAALQPFMWITLRCPYALVPEKHRACTVILFRYRAFESRVIHRMIFGSDSKALVCRVAAWPACDGPAFQNAIQFKPEVIMQSRCRMLLHDENIACFRSLAARGLRRVGKAAHLAVNGEGILPCIRHVIPLSGASSSPLLSSCSSLSGRRKRGQVSSLACCRARCASALQQGRSPAHLQREALRLPLRQVLSFLIVPRSVSAAHPYICP